MDKAVYTNKDFTLTLDADQRERHMKLTLQYKGTKQVAELNGVNRIVLMIWIASRMDEFFDFVFHTSAHKDPLNYRKHKQDLVDYKGKLVKEIFEDDDVMMIVELSETLADFLEEENNYAT